MYSKPLAKHRNNALIKRKEYLRFHPNQQIKLDYTATQKSPERSKQQIGDIGRILKK